MIKKSILSISIAIAFSSGSTNAAAADIAGVPKNLTCIAPSGAGLVYDFYAYGTSTTNRYLYQYIDANLNRSVLFFSTSGSFSTFTTNATALGFASGGDCNGKSLQYLSENGRAFGTFLPKSIP